MTKSRTLRKAGAVVLSLAMAFSVATVPASAAAKKPKLKATKATVKVDQSKTVKVVKNGTKIVKITVSSKDKAIATAKASGKTGVKVVGKAAGTVKVVAKITYKYKGKKKTVKKTLKVTVKPASTTNDDGTKVIEGKISIESGNALQSDNTVLVGDPLNLNVPVEVGALDQITWVKDGKTLTATSANADQKLFTYPTAKSGAGVYYALGITSKGTTYKSNELTVTDKVAPTKIENFEIVEVYDDTDNDADETPGDQIEYTATSKSLVAHFSVNRMYADSVFGICEADKTTKAFTADNKKFTGVAAQVNDKATAATVLTKANKNTLTLIATAGVGKKAEVYVSLPTAGATRGTSYVGIVDDAKIDTDTVGKGSENMSAAATAPYVIAPTAAAVASYSDATGAVKIELRGEDGKALAWLNGGLNTNPAAITVKGAAMTTNVTAATDTFVAPTGVLAISKGAITFTDAQFNKRYFYAKVTLAAKVFGATSVDLTSAVAEKTEEPAKTMTVEESGTTATSAVVKFGELASKASGTVYVWQTTADSVSAEIPKGAASASVTGGVSSVEVANVFAKDKIGQNYMALFVPADESSYSRMKSNVVLAEKFKKFKAGTYAVTGTTGAAIGAVNQFDQDITVAANIVTLFTTFAKNDPTIHLTNPANGQTAVITIADTSAAGGAVNTAVITTANAKGEFTFKDSNGTTYKLEITDNVSKIGKLTIS